MRVLLDASAIPAKPVGAGVYVLNLASALDGADALDLHLLTRRDDGGRWAALAPSATVHAVVPTSRPARLVWEQRRGPRLARELELDVWHGPHYTLPTRIAVPTVATVHDLTFFDHPQWHERLKVPYFRAAIRHACRKAAAVVVPSDVTARRLEAHHPRGRVVVAPHGVDHARFRPAVPVDEDVDAELLASIGAEPPFIAFAGTIEPRKNVPGLVDAFAQVARTHPDVRLVLAGGDGWGTDAVRDAVECSGVTTRILRPGYVPDAVLPALYRRAEVVAYPSFDEGFGLPVLEALACGAAVVTTADTSMAEVASDAARLVPADDTAALAGAIADLLDDPAVVATLRERGPAQAAPFTWARAAELHLEAYRAVAAE